MKVRLIDSLHGLRGRRGLRGTGLRALPTDRREAGVAALDQLVEQLQAMFARLQRVAARGVLLPAEVRALEADYHALNERIEAQALSVADARTDESFARWADDSARIAEDTRQWLETVGAVIGYEERTSWVKPVVFAVGAALLVAGVGYVVVRRSK